MANDAAEQLKQLRNDFRATFCGDNGQLHPAGERVLANLRHMSKYGSSPFSTDQATMSHVVGMQDVFRHIQMMLNISDAAIYRLMQTNQPERSFADD